MKQTVTMSNNKRTVINIPINTLMATQQLAPSCSKNDYEPEIVVISNDACCGKSEKAKLCQMVKDLEESYDKDIGKLQLVISSKEQQLKNIKIEHQKTVAQIRSVYNSKCSAFLKQIQQLNSKESQRQKQINLLKNYLIDRDQEILRLNAQMQRILKNRLIQFRQTEYIDKIHFLQSQKSLLDLHNKQLAQKLNLIIQQKFKNEDYLTGIRIQLEQSIKNLNKDIQVNKLNLNEAKKQIETLKLMNKSISQQLHQWQRKYSVLCKQLEATQVKFKIFSSKQSQFITIMQEFQTKINILQQVIKKHEETLLIKEKQNSIFTEKIVSLSKENQDFQLQCLRLKDLSSQREFFIEKIAKLQQTIIFIDNQKNHLLQQVAKLRIAYENKEKVYQVKIQRIVEGKEQIQQQKAFIFQLEQQIIKIIAEKQLTVEEIRRKQIKIQELIRSLSKYQAEITELKAQIRKYQGSFKWIVEKQISKDMQVANSTAFDYRVSKVAEYQREKVVNQDRHTQKVITQNIATGIPGLLGGFNPQQEQPYYY